jgi:hypothetical protein
MIIATLPPTIKEKLSKRQAQLQSMVTAQEGDIQDLRNSLKEAEDTQELQQQELREITVFLAMYEHPENADLNAGLLDDAFPPRSHPATHVAHDYFHADCKECRAEELNAAESTWEKSVKSLGDAGSTGDAHDGRHRNCAQCVANIVYEILRRDGRLNDLLRSTVKGYQDGQADKQTDKQQ